MRNFWKKKVPAFLLALLMVTSLVPMAGAASADIKVNAEAGKEVTIARKQFKTLFDTYSDETIEYVEFTSAGKLDDYGHFSAYDYSEKANTLDKKALEADAWFYYYDEDVPKNIDYGLTGLTFVANKNAKSGSFTMSFTIVGDKGDEVTGTMQITVDGSGSASADEIVLKVEAGKKTLFDAEAFYDFFDENYTSSSYHLKYVIFDTPSSSDLAYGDLYYNHGKSSQEKFTRTSFANATFYYNSSDAELDTEYPLDKVSFVADSDFDTDVELTFTAYYSSSKYVEGTLVLSADGKSSSSSSTVDGDIVYSVKEKDDVTFDKDDFKAYFNKSYTGSLKYVRFTDITNLDETGVLTTYVNDKGEWDTVDLDEDDALDGYFYYSDNDVTDDIDTYCLDGLGFEADDKTDGEVVVLEFTAYGTTSSKKVNGTLVIEIGDVKDSSGSKNETVKGDIVYALDENDDISFDPDDFKEFYKKTHTGTFSHIRFTDISNLDETGVLTTFVNDKDEWESVELDEDDALDGYFYFDDADVEDVADVYCLDGLGFESDDKTDGEVVVLEFTAYGTTSSKKVNGTLVIEIGDVKSSTDTTTPSTPSTSSTSASILYKTTPGTAVQLKANDFARFYESKIANSTFQSVKLLGVPSTGGLYYNYYGSSPYGTAARLQLTAYNCGNQTLYPSPINTTQYALTELTFVPAANTTNYTASIPFAASGTGGYTVYGSVMISVTSKAIPEIYGVTPKNTAVSFPAPSISTAVSTGTSATLLGIQLLELPAASVGTVYVGTGTARKAATSEIYAMSGNSWTISQLRFVPTTGYTGNVEIPYLAYDTNAKAIGVGTFSLGVVNNQVKFTDINSSTWCYKYVAELSDAKIISGYADGSFKPGNTISYGAALKLIMLAAGYGEQAPTVKGSTFSGYLAKAQAEGIVTRTNVNLSAPISRLQVAQLAAGAMKLDLNNLSTVNPFTDTADKHVLALSATGIMEGFTRNTFGPNSNLTRGQVSAIVWRMQNYK